jgi:predicted ABC-type ATPase
MTRANPQLLIIAGPNGAGKSTYSKDISSEGASIFDADKERAAFRRQFPDLPEQSIAFAVEQVFLDQVELTLKLKSDLTIETNFRDHALMATVLQFQKEGYKASLIYLGLSSIEQSIDRVQHRVHQGGHFVDNHSIRYNYMEGLNNLAFFADRFDAVRVIDTSGDYLSLRTVYQSVGREIIYLSEQVPKWAADTISVMISNLRSEQKRKQDDDESRNRGPRR